MAYAAQYSTEGVTVVPFSADSGGPSRKTTLQWRTAYDDELSAPRHEFIDPVRFDDVTAKHPKVLGACSFAGYPTVSHNATHVRLRSEATHYLMDTLFNPLVDALDETGFFLENHIGRIMIRPPGVAAAAESWHNDNTQNPAPNDQQIGGWLNMDSTPQFFACIKGTQRAARAGGFTPIPKSEHAKYNAALAAQAGQANTDARGLIVVPPGCIILFDSTIIHSIYPGKKKETSVKQFLGWRLTQHPDLSTIIAPDGHVVTREEFLQDLRNQTSGSCRSGQVHPMLPGMYCVIKKNMAKWDVFKQNLRAGAMSYDESQFRANHPACNKDFTRGLKSLRDIRDMHPDDVDMQPEYAEHDVALLLPGRKFTLTNPATGELEECALRCKEAPAKKARIAL